MFSHTRNLGLIALAVGMMITAGGSEADADYGYGQRQYYSSWSYQPTQSYSYTRYYYRPTVTSNSYSYHYCISYPSQPRYVYYYNPTSQVYWGRYDLEGKKGAEYSLLAEADRKKDLKAIPESAFPTPGAMPAIPDSKDGVSIEPIRTKPGDKPEDLPATN
ncbi:hypothetical protein Poly24_30330 [Rosistilla carotiformis]|uniref:Uncharacterized protein n=1 Tax=Rosistilla carotiformis TaxID=2528017 RepID=A0A518JUV9_9BACT|nr:hypothetical protein [Rosistilla carotiformis]QDV69318.1 hypothetical protein Poly24_30330 [Rosistilla carotiformis]